MDEIDTIKASAANGLTKVETEALVGHKLTDDQKTVYNKTKAVLKLKEKSKGKEVPMQVEETQRMPSLKERYTKAQVKEAIERCNGRWAAICAALNCSYSQLRVWMTNHHDHAQLADELRESLVAEAEEQVWNLLHSGDQNMRADIAKFILKTLGKSKGWNEQTSMLQQISTNGKDIEIKSIFGI